MKRVAIIGAGTSGLACIKSCLEEGLFPVCFEQTCDVGGLWNYTDEQCPERATVFHGVVTNTSKHISCYSDFPQPKEYPTYLPHHLFVEYFKQYIKQFNLERYIKFKHQIIKISKSLDHEATGCWVLRVKDLDTNEHVEEVYDMVMVCTGHHRIPRYPEYRGQDTFQGRKIHSQEYRRPEEFEDQRVLVIGMANSSCDMAVETSIHAKELYLSSRSGAWVFPRLFGGHPLDAGFTNWMFIKMKFYSEETNCKNAEDLCNLFFNHELYGVKPKRRFVSQLPVVNDLLPHQLLNGKVKAVGDVNHFTENGVVFKDDTTVHPIDVVIFGTGFRPHYPFLEGVIDVEQEITNIYKMIFPNSLSKNTLALIGAMDSDFYSSIFLFEMQARWASQIFSSRIQLPSRDVIKTETEQRVKRLVFRFGQNQRAYTACESPPYVDELMKHMGIKPSLFWLLVTDPKLFMAYLNGPILPCQTRLRGPHAWPGARQHIMSFREQYLEHLKKSNASQEDTKHFGCKWAKKTAIVLMVSVATWLYFRKCSTRSLPSCFMTKWLSVK